MGTGGTAVADMVGTDGTAGTDEVGANRAPAGRQDGTGTSGDE